MNMIVCIKQVMDPETPPASFKIDPQTNKVIPPPGIAPVPDPYSEYALEAALRLKAENSGKITAISLGNDLLRDVVKKSLAMGADELILLEDEAFAGGDSCSTAIALAAAIKKIGEYDIIFCGRQAADWGASQVGSGIAELLDLPCLTLTQKVEVTDGKAKVEVVTDDGYEVVETTLPAVITVSNELGEVRYPNIKGILKAKKKEPIIWKPADIGLEASEVGAAGRCTKLVKLFQPVREGEAEIISGDTPEEAAVNLALKLREIKLI